jgi:hypothetical protein
MEKILENIDKICNEFSFDKLYKEETKELWISGYKENIKFDLYIRPQKDGNIKLVFEIPQERKVCLFLNEEDTINRINKIFYENLYIPEKVEKEEITEGMQSYATN